MESLEVPTGPDAWRDDIGCGRGGRAALGPAIVKIHPFDQTRGIVGFEVK